MFIILSDTKRRILRNVYTCSTLKRGQKSKKLPANKKACFLLFLFISVPAFHYDLFGELSNIYVLFEWK